MYSWANGDHIWATIVSHSVATVKGVPDSVKVIELQAKDAAGTSINHPVNGTTFSVSKSYGFTRVWDLYDFPGNSFLAYDITSQGNLTIGEIFDYNVGDFIQITASITGQGMGAQPVPPSYIYKTVLGKSYSANGDTVHYEIRNESYGFTVDYTTSPPHLDTTYTDETIYESYTDLNSYMYDYLPSQPP